MLFLESFCAEEKHVGRSSASPVGSLEIEEDLLIEQPATRELKNTQNKATIV